VTLDFDVMPRRDIDNADRLAAALNELSARPRGSDTSTELEGADFLGWKTQSFDTEAGPLDVVPHAAAIGGFEDVATIELTLGELSIRAITIDEVIASKEKLGRPKDTRRPPGPLRHPRGSAAARAQVIPTCRGLDPDCQRRSASEVDLDI
jgi:hypothetical protein